MADTPRRICTTYRDDARNLTYRVRKDGRVDVAHDDFTSFVMVGDAHSPHYLMPVGNIACIEVADDGRLFAWSKNGKPWRIGATNPRRAFSSFGYPAYPPEGYDTIRDAATGRIEFSQPEPLRGVTETLDITEEVKPMDSDAFDRIARDGFSKRAPAASPPSGYRMNIERTPCRSCGQIHPVWTQRFPETGDAFVCLPLLFPPGWLADGPEKFVRPSHFDRCLLFPLDGDTLQFAVVWSPPAAAHATPEPPPAERVTTDAYHITDRNLTYRVTAGGRLTYTIGDETRHVTDGERTSAGYDLPLANIACIETGQSEGLLVWSRDGKAWRIGGVRRDRAYYPSAAPATPPPAAIPQDGISGDPEPTIASDSGWPYDESSIDDAPAFQDAPPVDTLSLNIRMPQAGRYAGIRVDQEFDPILRPATGITPYRACESVMREAIDAVVTRLSEWYDLPRTRVALWMRERAIAFHDEVAEADDDVRRMDRQRGVIPGRRGQGGRG